MLQQPGWPSQEKPASVLSPRWQTSFLRPAGSRRPNDSCRSGSMGRRLGAEVISEILRLEIATVGYTQSRKFEVHLPSDCLFSTNA